jgi:high-affinity iron transporter
LALPLWAKAISDPQLLQLVDYVGVDYAEAMNAEGEVKNPAEYEEMLEFAHTIHEAVQALPSSRHKPELVKQSDQLQALVRAKASLEAVREQAQALSKDLKKVLDVRLAPAKTPDIAQGKALFESHCASCHGEHGAGDGPLASNLVPAPSNFLEVSRMDQLSLFALYNTISLGVKGTSMAAYGQSLKEDDRWNLAAYIRSLTQPTQLASDPLVITLEKLALSMKAYEEQDPKAAYQFALSAYLDGFETAEAVLDILNHDQRILLEKKMIAFRSAIEARVPLETLQTQYQELKGLLTQVQESLPTTQFSAPAIFLSALVILLREGLESILIVGMLIVMLIKGERRDLLPAVHAGWLLALVAGTFTWWGSHTLISVSGAVRELTEGITALIAAAMLLYVGVWIHRNQLAQDWRKYLQEKLNQHLSSQEARWGLGLLAFLAVYREVFETVLFYEALALQVGPLGMSMVWLGIGLAGVILLITVFSMIRFGLRIPLQQFFRVSSWLIFIFAIIFIGQGIHGLEEAGKVPVWPVPLPRIDLLGLYPNLFGLSIQALVLALALFLGRRGAK